MSGAALVVNEVLAAKKNRRMRSGECNFDKDIGNDWLANEAADEWSRLGCHVEWLCSGSGKVRYIREWRRLVVI